MVRFVRTVRIKPGKIGEAVGWAKEIAGYINSKAGIEVTVLMQQFGAFGTICWATSAEDAGEISRVMAQLAADPGYQQVVNKNVAQLVVEATTHDTLWQEV